MSVILALPELAEDGLSDVSAGARAGTTNRVIDGPGTVRFMVPEFTATFACWTMADELTCQTFADEAAL